MIQDVRGRFASEGRFIPFHDDGWGENRDGYDTVEWIAAQPWCDGNVGTDRRLVRGATRSTGSPDHARPTSGPCTSGSRRPTTGRSGSTTAAPSSSASWSSGRSSGPTTTSGGSRGARRSTRRRKGILEKALEELPELAPRAAAPPRTRSARVSTTGTTSSSAHPDDGPYWWRWNIGHRHGDIETPIVHMGGLVRHLPRGDDQELRRHRARRRGTQAARDAQRLVVGPWIHGPWNMAKTVQGEVDFGSEAIRDYNAHPRPLVRPLAPRRQERASPTSLASSSS